MGIEYRIMRREEIEKIRSINRAELIERVYYLRDGMLELKDEEYDMKGWPPGHIDKIVAGAYELFDSAGVLIGAFDNEDLVGITGVENRFRGIRRDTLKMDILFVSRSYRKQGIGNRLVIEASKVASNMGARKLYISATPSENTVNFYLGVGCQLASEIDPELFELEPEDIHLELRISEW